MPSRQTPVSPVARCFPLPTAACQAALALAAVLALGGCATLQTAVDTVKAKLPAPAEPAAETREPEAPAAEVKPVKPVAKPARKPLPAPAADPTPPPPKPVIRSAPKPTIAGPAWLAKCADIQSAGGAVRCDADSLLARPSATVQVFTRDPALAVKASSGDITLRPGLPRRYRFFVLP
ncbi:hypothetical protein [Denitromonas ohlonensis]|uniref:Uncharacterized protein n=2 Tax=Denitromonas TaxID=139331 RepID=A0A557RTJ1_9RHOO|nr:hypothetical protein [Denitromonas ohlonensis]TVO68480.1 hypothetical protein FHP90_04165 [Denitromonas ohlonensis]TVO74758.1 hypothetical protein FHP89_15715 [Denitromonas ohlonensis]